MGRGKNIIKVDLVKPRQFYLDILDLCGLNIPASEIDFKLNLYLLNSWTKKPPSPEIGITF